MKRFLIVFLSLILLAGLQQSSLAKPANLTLLNDINISSSVDNTKIELKFDRKPSQEKILFHNDFVQLEFPDSYTSPAKQWLKVEDNIVKNIFVYQFDTTTVRVRLFTYNKAKSLKDRIRFNRAGNGLIIIYAQGAAAVSRNVPVTAKHDTPPAQKNMSDKQPPVEVEISEKVEDASLSQNSDLPVSDKGIVDDTNMTDLIKEASLPGKQETVEAKPELLNDSPGLTGSIIKMVTGLGIVLSLLFGVLYLAKKFLGKKMGLAGQEQKIKVVTSTYLGPKKSIALVEVAGEKIVVGVTATHITMLTKIGRDEDFAEVLKEQIKTSDKTDMSQGLTKGEGVTKGSTDEKVELQDELWEKV